MMPNCGDHKTKSDQSEDRGAVLDRVERRSPQKEPDENRNRKRPHLDRKAGDEMQRETDAADLRRQHEQMDSREDEKGYKPERKAEVLADGAGESFLRDGRETARHLDEKDDDDRGEDQRPDELKAKMCAR